MQIKGMIGAAVCVMTLGSSAPVWADIAEVTYTGTVRTGWDYAGIFGAVGDLTGQAYTSRYTFETASGGSANNGLESYVYGGSSFGLPSPSVSASMTINAITISWIGNYSAQIYGADDSVQPFVYSAVSHWANYLLNGGIYTGMIHSAQEMASGYYPLSLTDPFSANLIGNVSGSFVKYTNNWTLDVEAELTPERISINTPVPEPETYAMMLAGLGLLGVVARRRKQKAAA